MSDAPDIESVPIEDITPKRRGRPPGSKNRAPSVTIRGRLSKAAIREQCAMLVGGINAVASFIPQYIPPEDLLDNAEMDRLTDALAAECNASTRIIGWLSRATAISAHGMLISACIAIILPRLQRRGLVPGGIVEPRNREELEAMKTQYPHAADELEAHYGPRFVSEASAANGSAYTASSF